MKRLLILFAIFALGVLIGLTIWAGRAARASEVSPGSDNLTSHLVIKAGTPIRVRVVAGFSKGSKPGEQLQAIVVQPVDTGAQSVVPLDTRAILQVVSIQKRHHRKPLVTLQLTALVSQNGNVPVHTDAIKTDLQRTSDLDLMTRAAGGLIGGAVGAAVGGAAGADPAVGASAIGGMAAAGTGTDTDNGDILLFDTVSAIELNDIKW
jgi:hypothetical protein